MRINTTDPQNEVFDVVNEKDEVIGEATRREVHQNPKLIHRAVHIWILNDKGEILLQQRSLTKDKAPGQWDISCAGHVKKGNSAEKTAQRELKEELGISTDFRLIKKFIDRDIDQTEMVSLYYVFHNGPFKYPKEEIQQVKFFAKDKVLEFIRNDPKVNLVSKEEIPVVFEYLEREKFFHLRMPIGSPE